MSIFKDLFSAGAAKLVGTVGTVIDDLVTSDEERMQLKNQLETAIMDHNDNQMKHVENMEQQITDRHSADMASDSWLSKNVRPMTLMFLTVGTVILAYLTIFTLAADKLPILTPWINLLTTLLVTVYGFYFGSRGLEKITLAIKGSGDNEPKTGPQDRV